jgi:NADH dehydrogenase
MAVHFAGEAHGRQGEEPTTGHDAVTGALGYTGRSVTERLVALGRTVVSLTGHPGRPNPFGERVREVPYLFHDANALALALEGVDTLYNTYWVRFARGRTDHEQAVENTRTMIRAAELAGVRRLVHVSITNCSLDSPLPYYQGKAKVEESIRESRLTYAILRPTVVFGREDILLNNIAWTLRRSPLFLVPGSGEYRVQPVFVEDLADRMVRQARRSENAMMDVAGPEVFTFNELVALLREHVGSRSLVLRVPPAVALAAAGILGLLLRDVVLTRDEGRSLAANLLVCNGPSTAPTRFTAWLAREGHILGRRYANELDRHYRHIVPSPPGRG